MRLLPDRASAAAWSGLALIGGAFASAALTEDLRASSIAALVTLGVGVSGALLVVRAASALAPPVMLVALLMLRLLGLLGEPTLSDDIHRYIHEGRAQRLGLARPYTTPPSQFTPPPDDGTTTRVNHPDVPAAYPPGTELVLWWTVALGDVLGHPRLPVRASLVLADMLVVLMLYRRRAQHPLAFVRYGAHPLPLLEVALGAHLDGLGVAALVAGVLTSRPFLAGALMGLGAHVKPVAAVALVAIRRRALPLAAAGFLVAVVVPALPHLVAGAPIHRGFLEYATRWRAAPFVYAAIEAPLAPLFDARAAAGRYAHLHITSDGVVLEESGRAVVSIGAARHAPRPIIVDAGFCARIIAGGLLAAILAVIARARASPAGRVGYALTAFWLFAPTVHPWYLTWIVPFAAVTSSRALWAFSAASPLLYQPVFGFARAGTWDEATWPRVVVVAALVVGLLWDGAGRRDRQS